jgi:Zinc finger, C3HC4 type (RING finger)
MCTGNKRLFQIGPHTFHLHEIYGLSAHGAQPPNTTDLASSSPTTEAHTYPPPPTSPTTGNDEPSSECLLCLSSPREVVLLPCRHLVACRECAVNMVEYGAGGNIVHNDASETAQTPSVGGANESAEPADATPNGASGDTPTPAPTQRRKRRAKGWFCPVCRQRMSNHFHIE